MVDTLVELPQRFGSGHATQDTLFAVEHAKLRSPETQLLIIAYVATSSETDGHLYNLSPCLQPEKLQSQSPLPDRRPGSDSRSTPQRSSTWIEIGPKSRHESRNHDTEWLPRSLKLVQAASSPNSGIAILCRRFWIVTATRHCLTFSGDVHLRMGDHKWS